MHLVQDENTVQVIVKTKQRDKEGRLTYQTVESFDVGGASPEQVVEHVRKSFNSPAQPANTKK